MSWDRVLGHDVLVERFRHAIARGRLASTFLFVGPNGVGKRRFAHELTRSLLCQRREESVLEACGECEGCHLFAAGSHPDFVTVAKPEDRAEIPIDLLIGDREHRNRRGLCQRGRGKLSAKNA
jgi:DNA polymerase-3 subunit delta'